MFGRTAKDLMMTLFEASEHELMMDVFSQPTSAKCQAKVFFQLKGVMHPLANPAKCQADVSSAVFLKQVMGKLRPYYALYF